MTRIDDDARDDRQREERAVVARIEVQERGREERPGDGAGVIHRAVEAEDAPPRVRRGEVREHRVARRAADALAEAIGETDREHLRPGRRDRDQRPHRRRQAVAAEHELLRRAPAIGQPARDDLEDAVGRFGGPLDHAERHRARAEHPRQEQRQQRIHHLGRGVGEEAHPPEQPHGPRQAKRGRVASGDVIAHRRTKMRRRYIQASSAKRTTRLASAYSSDAFFGAANGTK